MSISYVYNGSSWDDVRKELRKYFEEQHSRAQRDKERQKLLRDKRFYEGMEHSLIQTLHFIDNLYIEVNPEPKKMTLDEVFSKRAHEIKDSLE